ncbi:hypothetical protein ACFLV8_00210 [Chloroflexota bacterium]
MEYEKAIAILTNLLDKPSLNADEKEAITAALGVLSWAILSQNRIKDLEAKREARQNKSKW